VTGASVSDLRRRAAPRLIYDAAMVFRVALVVALIGCRDARPALLDAAEGDGAAADAARDAPGDASGSNDGDGPVTRQPCASAFGAGLTASEFGRLDGFLVAIVAPGGSKPCRADTDHLHLQIKASNQIYDIAINIGSDVHTATIDRAAFSAWSEGWHTTGDGTSGDVFVDYPGLGLHADTIPLSTTAALVSAMTSDLATVNHISLYATSYTTADGAHLIHYNGVGHDGMIVTKPLSPTAHMRAFSFDGQAF